MFDCACSIIRRFAQVFNAFGCLYLQQYCKSNLYVVSFWSTIWMQVIDKLYCICFLWNIHCPRLHVSLEIGYRYYDTDWGKLWRFLKISLCHLNAIWDLTIIIISIVVGSFNCIYGAIPIIAILQYFMRVYNITFFFNLNNILFLHLSIG